MPADDVTYQSTTPATPPSGTVVATDEAGSPARQYQLVKLVDGTANSEMPVVGMASQPDGTEGGLVIRPASLVPDVTATGSITGNGQTVVLALANHCSAIAKISGTWTGTLISEASWDGGTTWNQTAQTDANDMALAVPEIVANHERQIVFSGPATHVRIKSTAWTSGTASITLRASIISANPMQLCIGLDGGVSALEGVHVGGVDASGNFAIAQMRPGTPTASVTGLVVRPFLPTNGTLTVGLVDETGSSAVDTLAVGGGTPHDSVDSGNPIKLGVKAASAFPTAVAANDRANVIGDLWGRPMVTHIDPAQQVWKSFNATSAQTGVTIWDPTAGKKIAITSIVIGTYGTTAGRAILWFGANGDTTYSAGTDQLVLAFSSAPSASSKPGLVFCPAVPIFCTTADMELHITTDANLSIDVAVAGYEWA